MTIEELMVIAKEAEAKGDYLFASYMWAYIGARHERVEDSLSRHVVRFVQDGLSRIEYNKWVKNG